MDRALCRLESLPSVARPNSRAIHGDVASVGAESLFQSPVMQEACTA
jgi:hypothetical protein